jgi:hypothetical protein
VSPRATLANAHVSPRALVIGAPIANGNFGAAYWGQYGESRCVVKQANLQPHAQSYLDTEAEARLPTEH